MNTKVSFIQKERDKFIYYEREYNEAGEKTSQVRLELKLDKLPDNGMFDKVKEILPDMKDGDRIEIE